MKIKKTKSYKFSKLAHKLISLGLAGALMISQAVPLLAETVEPVEISEITGTHYAEESKASKYAFEYRKDDWFSPTSVTITNLPQDYSGALVIPKTIDGLPVTKIDLLAFYDCSHLTSVTIPNSVTEINYGAFSGCSSLKTITIPNSVTVIDSNAFSKCTSLTNITLPNSITKIGSYAFLKCTNLTNITLPNSITKINSAVFSECTTLEKITIPNSVTVIDEMAFWKCSNLKSVTMSNSVTVIGSNAFQDCTSLTNITIPKGISKINSSVFHGCSSLTSITIPDNVNTIDDWAFSGCKSLKSVVIPDSVTSIGYGSFWNCPNLTICMTSDNSYIKKHAIDNYIPYKIVVTKPLKPTNVKATAQSTSTINVTWNKVTGADGYEVYRFVNGRSVFYKAFDKDTTSFNNIGKKPNTTYYYKIRSYKNNGSEKLYSGYTDLFTCTTPKTDTKPLKPTNTKATAQSSSVIKVTWNKVAGADGYEVYRFVNGRSVFYKAFDEDTTTFNNAGKKPNTTYYYKIRSYKEINGKKLYSGYTDLFTCTTPKK